MTDDLGSLDAWYDEVFAPVRLMTAAYNAADKRDASLLLIGDLCIEPLAPAFRESDWPTSPLGRFFQRFGCRWHSIAWYIEPPNSFRELYQSLAKSGMRVYGTGAGRNVKDTGPMFTHPGDSVTQLEFYPAPSDPDAWFDARFKPGFDPSWWTKQHPLHIRRTSHITLAVHDLQRYRAIYIDTLGGRLLCEALVDITRTRSAFVAVGTDLVIELAEPLDDTSIIARELEEKSQGLHAVWFKVRDLDRAEKHLDAKGVRAILRDTNNLVTDASTTGGVVMGFTSADIPHDARADWDQRNAH
jgi:catechol 2,3-dioxygenase-like lactoylglutathione lyase family enzyme